MSRIEMLVADSVHNLALVEKMRGSFVRMFDRGSIQYRLSLTL